nr:MAG: hypothetical protein [Picobirnavirus sp.]
MTANQIAYASVEEDKRHNGQVEVETNRHNEATEALQNEANRINDEKNSITDRYETRRNDIQAEYNRVWLEIQKSQGQQKIDLEKQLNDIKAESAQHDNAYKDAMAGIEDRRVTNQELAREEDQRHNKEMELLESTRLGNEFLLNTKRIEYENTYHRSQITQTAVANLIKLREQKRADEYLKLDQQSRQYTDAKVDQEQKLLQKEFWWYDWSQGPGKLLPSGKLYWR